jgi:hypothetical protein
VKLRLTGEYPRAPIQRAERRKERRGKGTPPGVQLSPLPANLYLEGVRNLMRHNQTVEVIVFVVFPVAETRVFAYAFSITQDL